MDSMDGAGTEEQWGRDANRVVGIRRRKILAI